MELEHSFAKSVLPLFVYVPSSIRRIKDHINIFTSVEQGKCASFLLSYLTIAKEEEEEVVGGGDGIWLTAVEIYVESVAMYKRRSRNRSSIVYQLFK